MINMHFSAHVKSWRLRADPANQILVGTACYSTAGFRCLVGSFLCILLPWAYHSMQQKQHP